MPTSPPIRFAAIGLNHSHIYGQTDDLLTAGAELGSFYAEEPALVKPYSQRYPQAKLVSGVEESLEDESIQRVITAGIPRYRAALGIEVMRHGKDFMSDKPGFILMEQLAKVRHVQAETGRIFSICYSERFRNRATVKAGQLVKAGAIGQVLQTIIMAPHHARFEIRPDWFFQPDLAGGILSDIGSHQFDQFLYFTGSTQAEVVNSQVANYQHPTYPRWEDFGDALVRGDGGTGYIRVDWFTPDGLGAWGDGRLTILGTDG